MKERLLVILKNNFYKENDNECICPRCVFCYTTTDLFKMPDETLIKQAKEEIRQAINILEELRLENKIDPCINPFLVSIVILENLLGKHNLNLKTLRDNALILGYIHSYIQYLWYAENIRREHPTFSEERINKIMFNSSLINDIEVIEIGIEAKKKNKDLDGFVIYEPILTPNGDVDMQYKFIGIPQFIDFKN